MKTLCSLKELDSYLRLFFKDNGEEYRLMNKFTEYTAIHYKLKELDDNWGSVEEIFDLVDQLERNFVEEVDLESMDDEKQRETLAALFDLLGFKRKGWIFKYADFVRTGSIKLFLKALFEFPVEEEEFGPKLERKGNELPKMVGEVSF